jgi:hypothetical protein
MAISVFLWVFLLDSAFVIFNNLPPRMMIKEMKCHLAASEAAFQAGTREQCFLKLLNESTDDRHTLSYHASELSQAPLAADEQRNMAEIGPLNLFALGSGKELTSLINFEALTRSSSSFPDIPSATSFQPRQPPLSRAARTSKLDFRLANLL